MQISAAITDKPIFLQCKYVSNPEKYGVYTHVLKVYGHS